VRAPGQLLLEEVPQATQDHVVGRALHEHGVAGVWPVVGRDQGEVRLHAALPAGAGEGLADDGRSQLLAAEIARPVELADEAQPGEPAVVAEAVDLVAQGVAVQPTAGGEQGRVAGAGLQLVDPPGGSRRVVQVHELQDVAGHGRHPARDPEQREGDHALGREQPLGLELHAGEEALEPGQVGRGRAVGPAGDELEPRPDPLTRPCRRGQGRELRLARRGELGEQLVPAWQQPVDELREEGRAPHRDQPQRPAPEQAAHGRPAPGLGIGQALHLRRHGQHPA